jgi:two-component system OmpR family sensor kinase
LLLLLCGAVVLTACVQAYITYRTSLEEINDIFDYQMQQMAQSLRPGLPVGGYHNNGPKDESEDGFAFIIQVSIKGGQTIFLSTPTMELPKDAAPGFSTYEDKDVVYEMFTLASGKQLIQVAQDREARRNVARTMAIRTGTPVLVMVPFLIFLVWWVVSASLSPVERVRKQVASRDANELNPIDEKGLPVEIFPLVYELNLLFQRVRNAFDAQQNFIADAAHELRSPLSALKLQVEGLRRSTDESTREVAVNRLAQGIERAARLVEQLLILARQQAAPNTPGTHVPVPLGPLVKSLVAHLWESANARQIDMGVTEAADGVVSGHHDALNILIRNLLDNAIKYTPVGGTVNVAVRSLKGNIHLIVEDSGPGIPEDVRDRVFDRFFRVAGTQGEGSGLGLSIVRTIADMHAAQLTITQSQALGGIQVEIVFPAASLPTANSLLAP